MSNAITIPQSRVGQKFIMFSAAVMGLQFLFGIIAAAQYVWPNLLFHIAPFNFTRMLHINTLVVSLLAGFMGATYFLIAEEAGGKLHSEKLGNINFWLTFGGIGAVVAGYLYLNFSKTYSLWLSEGREYIEAPRWADWAIVAVVLLFLFNIIQTVRKRAAWDDITRMLVIGLAALGGIYLFGMFFFANVSVDQFFWWWVIHLWVEGVWELIAAALYALLLIRLFNFPRERAAKYVYIEAGLVLFTGIVGTGHHYYWIGTPQYWLLFGGMFSAFEVLPLFVMTFDALRFNRESSQARFEHPNQVARLWLVGGVILHLVGAGIWGFIQTLPSVNRWTHGTQMTTAHGHLAFYGAYAMLIIAIVYYALPRMRFGTDFFDQRRGKWAFWIAGSGMLVMTLAMSFAGILQVYFERVAGRPYMEAQAYLGVFYEIRFWAGVMMAIGLVLFLLDVFALRPAHRVAESEERPPRLAVQPTTLALLLGLVLLNT